MGQHTSNYVELSVLLFWEISSPSGMYEGHWKTFLILCVDVRSLTLVLLESSDGQLDNCALHEISTPLLSLGHSLGGFIYHS